jgi:hypothetical protein
VLSIILELEVQVAFIQQLAGQVESLRKFCLDRGKADRIIAEFLSKSF